MRPSGTPREWMKPRVRFRSATPFATRLTRSALKIEAPTGNEAGSLERVRDPLRSANDGRH
jgi:hypothetical protein